MKTIRKWLARRTKHYSRKLESWSPKNRPKRNNEGYYTTLDMQGCKLIRTIDCDIT